MKKIAWNKKNYIGNKYGKLTIIKEENPYISKTSKSYSMRFLCKCDCGKEKIVIIGNLTRGFTKTCGCGFNNEVVDFEGEIWKDIPNFDKLYKVSNKGRIKSKKGIVKDILSNAGYRNVSLYKNKKYFKTGIHRLVAQAFISNPDNKPQVNHIDGIKINNNLNNLEWMTAKENSQHAHRNGLSKVKKGKDNHLYGIMGKDHKDSIQVNQLTLDGDFIKTWDSISDVRRELGLSAGNICLVCKGTTNRKQTGGFKWEYKI